jgi:hypothetical protein
MPDADDKIQQLGDEAEQDVADAFVEAITALIGGITIAALAGALSGGDVDGVTNAMGIEDDRWDDLSDQLDRNFTPRLATLYADAGAATATTIGNGATSPLRTRFSLRDGPIVQETVQAQRRLARTMTRRLLGENEAYDRARLIRQTIGLSENQATTVAAFRDQLDGNAPPNSRNVLNRATLAHLNAAERAQVKKHMREGHLDRRQRHKLINDLRDRLLTGRAATIARTETQRTANQAEHHAWLQAAENGVIDKNNVRRYWITARDERVRLWHRSIPGMNADGKAVDEPFETTRGPVMYPPAGVNCRCRVFYTSEG